MPRLHAFILHPLTSKIFLYALASVYVIYMVAFGRFLSPFSTWWSAPSTPISEHTVETNASVTFQHWTVANMQAASLTAQLTNLTPNMTQIGSDQNAAKAAKQEGQRPSNENLTYPLSTVGKIFFTNGGRDSMCSGTAVISLNHSVVDTAGHCLYLYGNWAQNVIFCPLYENGSTPYGCWAARALEVPSDWISAKPNDYHHDMGIAIVAPNSQGALTDAVGGAGWAYNQPVNQPFYAYGYPAGYPFDGQTRQSCSSSSGTLWQHGAGNVISIPCNMTGGSSGGPWFIQINGNWYLNGHNDFISSIKLGHMFSPYYDDTWYAMYDKAQKEKV